MTPLDQSLPRWYPSETTSQTQTLYMGPLQLGWIVKTTIGWDAYGPYRELLSFHSTPELARLFTERAALDFLHTAAIAFGDCGTIPTEPIPTEPR